MADSEDLDDLQIVVNPIDNAIRALPDAKPVIVARQLLATGRPWVVAESLNPLHDPLAIDLPRHRLDLFGGGALNAEAISCHGAEAR